MTKTNIFLKSIMVFLIPFTLSFMSGCASMEAEQGTSWEPWVGELTGMLDAGLKMSFSRIEEEADVFLVKGSFEGNISSFSAGYGSGTMNGKITGKVKDGIFNVRMWGTASVSDGSVTIDGKMIGTLSKTQAFGAWNIIARDDEIYEFSGEWSAKKIDPESQGN